MKKKRVVLGITGCIAAYKAPDLVRSFCKSGFEVTVVMTEAATKFITPLTLQSVSGNQVITSIFNSTDFKHLEVAREADLMVIAPATANFIAKASTGIADDALSTIFLAAQCPKVIAPAMNFRMYENEATQQNISVLKNRGVVFIGPEKGELACGEEGVGRLAGVETILEVCLKQSTVNSSRCKNRDKQQSAVLSAVQSTKLKGKKFLVTAGGTREKIDAVRCITNLSSGKTGSAIAKELADRGADVTLLTSQQQNPPKGVEVKLYESYEDLKKLLELNFPDSDCLIMSAAVSDFKPLNESKDKLKRGESLSLQLTPTGDLLQNIAKDKKGKLVIGFAAETKDVEKNAMLKLKKKNLDMIIANDVSKSDSGIGKEYCDFTVIYPDGRKINLGKQTKTAGADKIVDLVTGLVSNKVS